MPGSTLFDGRLAWNKKVLAPFPKTSEACCVRYNKTSVFVLSVLVLTANYAAGTLPASSTSNPQAAEAKAQETVDLKISGMT
jgi:hypothetical protein